MQFRVFFDYLILFVAAVGLFVNVCATVLLCLKRRPSQFHYLLMILAVFDTLVVLCCAVSYGLPGR